MWLWASHLSFVGLSFLNIKWNIWFTLCWRFQELQESVIHCHYFSSFSSTLRPIFIHVSGSSRLQPTAQSHRTNLRVYFSQRPFLPNPIKRKNLEKEIWLMGCLPVLRKETLNQSRNTRQKLELFVSFLFVYNYLFIAPFRYLFTSNLFEGENFTAAELRSVYLLR